MAFDLGLTIAKALSFASGFTYFAVLNVVTAVFCQSAIESAQKDHATVVQNMLDNKESHLQKLRTLFSKMGAEEAGGITFGMFEEKINSQAVREYFETLGLDVWDPWSFFKLLDSDGGGFVEVEEFFLGCLRFSGAAKAMDVGKLIQDQTWLIRSQGRFQRRPGMFICCTICACICCAEGKAKVNFGLVWIVFWFNG